VGDDPLKIGRMVSVPALWGQIEKLKPFDPNDPDFQRQVALFREQYEALGRAYGQGGSGPQGGQRQLAASVLALGQKELEFGDRPFTQERADGLAQQFGFGSWREVLSIMQGQELPETWRFPEPASVPDDGGGVVPEETTSASPMRDRSLAMYGIPSSLFGEPPERSPLGTAARAVGGWIARGAEKGLEEGALTMPTPQLGAARMPGSD
jgi:hypothetical protein